MHSAMREVVVRSSDFDLFGQDMSPADYEFFQRHTGAFKTMLADQSREKKKEFVEGFKNHALYHGCLKDVSAKNDSRLIYLEEATELYKDNFVNGKYSSAKKIVKDAAILAQNKDLLKNMGAKSFSRDPFTCKETRDVFRRLFGSPSLDGTFIKVICVLPLHIKFGGSICRYLRRWLDCEPVRPLPVQASKQKKSKQNAPPGRSTSKKKELEEAKRKEEEDQKEFLRFQMSISEFVSRHDPYHLEQLKATLEAYRIENNLPEEECLKKSDVVYPSHEECISLARHFERKKAEGTLDDKNPTGGNASVSDTVPISEEKNSVHTDEMMAHYQNEDFFKPMSSTPEKEDADSPTGNDDDNSYEEIKKMLLLNKPHPNVEFEQLLGKKLSEEDEIKLTQCKKNAKQLGEQIKTDKECMLEADDSFQEKVKKRHACANCRIVEPEPKTFKKCQRCRGKRTRFYCSRSCQEKDWANNHREDHNSIEDVT